MYVAKNVFRGNLKSCFYEACGTGENRKIANGFGNECVKYRLLCMSYLFVLKVCWTLISHPLRKCEHKKKKNFYII